MHSVLPSGEEIVAQIARPVVFDCVLGEDTAGMRLIKHMIKEHKNDLLKELPWMLEVGRIFHAGVGEAYAREEWEIWIDRSSFAQVNISSEQIRNLKASLPERAFLGERALTDTTEFKSEWGIESDNDLFPLCFQDVFGDEFSLIQLAGLAEGPVDMEIAFTKAMEHIVWRRWTSEMKLVFATHLKHHALHDVVDDTNPWADMTAEDESENPWAGMC